MTISLVTPLLIIDTTCFVPVVNKMGKCLAARENCQDVVLWDCIASNKTQLWAHMNYNNITKLGHLCNMQGKCIASPRNTNQSTPLILSSLNDCELGQKWDFIWYHRPVGVFLIDSQVTSAFGKCLAVENDSAVSGARIVATDCNSTDFNQRWHI